MNAQDFLFETILELKDIDESDLNADLTLEELALASLDYVEIQVLIKKKYGIEVKPDLLISGKLRTVGDFAAYIEERAAATV
ncbi:acyl carrier protein [Cognatiluteimonas telluris]|jgi:acyl carrier protein|uniref:acyl carrier protein n=1 Tax=Cognatiluteimonas telluris TaxID=1104775 RepID=UPI00140C8C1C|nr:phosphopantetheine-binding protein [Lysobacter telluris]